MTFDWKEYLIVAQFLNKHLEKRPFSKEAAQRSGVSRAYYAAYCYARNKARDTQNFVPKKGAEDHGRLRDHFRRRKNFVIANILDELRQWRNQCDYDDSVENLDQLINAAIQNAEDIINKLNVD